MHVNDADPDRTDPDHANPINPTNHESSTQMSNQPTTLEIVRNIENGNRKQAAEQITEHPESARMAIAVLSTLANDPGWPVGSLNRDVFGAGDDAESWRNAAATVVRTLNAGKTL
jgi:hypothetical protein